MIQCGATKGERQWPIDMGIVIKWGYYPKASKSMSPKTTPVRAYDAFVEALDFRALGIEIDPHQVGNSEYDPKAMMKLLVYGYSYGVRSSRKLERETHQNIAFIWLMGGLKPDHKTIAEYRRKNKRRTQEGAEAMCRVMYPFGSDCRQCFVCGWDQDSGQCGAIEDA